MLSMHINHPDILEFITKKQDLTKVTGANISVKITNEFMKAVLNNSDYILRYPINSSFENMEELSKDISYNTLKSVIIENNIVGYIKKVKAEELWNILIECAWKTAEPGILFEDAMHDEAPDGVYPNFRMISTNPCGEIPMGEYDSCRLIHQNLASYVEHPFTQKAYLNIPLLIKHTRYAMRLADDLIDLEIEHMDKIICKIESVSNISEILDQNNHLIKKISPEAELWLKIRTNTLMGRRAGLGNTGLADCAAMLGIKYGSDDFLAFTERIQAILFTAQLATQIELAKERGAFPAFTSSLEASYCENTDKFIGNNSWYSWLIKKYPTFSKEMFLYGRRNISWSTVKIAAA